MKNNTKTPSVSVIIPVYNVEKYLPKCLDSIINQTLENIEIICINDESPDNCAAILEEYAKKDKRIIVLNEPNSGQGAARNRGLKIARGKYIQFLDSDDYYEPNCCEEMYNLMEKNADIDVACFGCNIVYEEFSDNKKFDDKYFNVHYIGKHKIIPTMVLTVDCNCWNKIFRKSFIEQYNLRFPEKLHFEDNEFFWAWLTKSEYAYFCPKKLTNYVRRKDSDIGKVMMKKSNKLFDSFEIYKHIYENLISSHKWDKYREVFLRRYINEYFWLSSCVNNVFEGRKLIDIISNFLTKIDCTDVNLCEYEKICLRRLLHKKYSALIDQPDYEITEATPVFERSINIVFSIDLNFVAPLAVTIQSIIENSSPQNNYDIVILYDDAYEWQKSMLLSLIDHKSNFSIRFFNMKKWIDTYHVEKFFISEHISLATYYRLFIGKIFSRYNRILYLDCDLVVNTDIALLFNQDIKDFPIAAVLDSVISYQLINDSLNISFWNDYNHYMQEVMGFINCSKTFNSGVLLIDIKKFNELDFEHILMLVAKNNRYFHDQNIFNALFQDNYYQLSPEWNFQWHIKMFFSNYKDILPENIVAMYDNPKNMPKIIHYCSNKKPWINPTLPKAEYFWKYAKHTPFYEEILQRMLGANHVHGANNNMSKPFSAIPVVNKIKYKLFNFIPLWSRYIEGEKCKYKLFGFPLLSRKIKGGRTVYKFCGIPVWKIRKMANNITTKYYLCGIPLLKVSKK